MAERLRALPKLPLLAILFRLQFIQTWRAGKSLKAKIQSVFFACLLGFMAFVWAAASFFIGRRAGESAQVPMLMMMVILALCFYGVIFVMFLSAGSAAVSFDVSKLFHLPLGPGELILSQYFGGLVLNPAVILFPASLCAGLTAGALSIGHATLGLSFLASFLLWVLQFCAATLMVEYVLTRIHRSIRAVQAVVLTGTLMLLAFLIIFGYLQEKHGWSLQGFMEGVKERWDYWEIVIRLLPGFSPVGWIGTGWYRWVIIAASLVEAGLFYAGAHFALRSLMTSARTESVARIKTVGGSRTDTRFHLLESISWWPFLRKDFRFSPKNQSSGMLFVVVMINLLLPLLASDPDAIRFYDPIMHWVAPLVGVVLTGMLAVNALGVEGPGLMLIMASGSPRWRFIMGKNVAGLLFGVLPVLIPMIYLAFEGEGATEIAGLFFLAASVCMAQTGIANFISIVVPYPAAQAGKSLFPPVSHSRMLLVSLVQIIMMNFGALLQIPLFFGYMAYRSGLEFNAPHLAWTAGAVMLLYGTCILILSVFFSGRLMLKMEPYIFEKLLRQR